MTFIFFRKSHNIFNILLLIVLHMIAFTSSLISTYISKSGITPFFTHPTIFKASLFALSLPFGVFIQVSRFVLLSSAGPGTISNVLEISTLQLLSCASCDMYLLLTILFLLYSTKMHVAILLMHKEYFPLYFVIYSPK